MSSARGGSGKRTTRRSKSPDMVQGESPGLRRIVQNRLLKDVFDSTSEKHPGWKVLIVDDHAMRVISSAVGMYDIMERKVTLVESLEKKRAPFPDMGAIYLIDACQASVDRLVADFSSKPLYGSNVFLFFLGHLPDDLFASIKGCKQLLKRLKCLTEINIDFLAKEERAFTFDMRNSFPALYLRQGAAPAELALAQKLVTVCGSLNEYPHIRYKDGSAVCQGLASLFKLKMDEFVSKNPAWWYHGGPKKNQMANKERGTLLLLDRADDCLSPLMHDFTYQPMVHDLLEMDGDRITYDNDTGKKTDVLLDDKDSIWVELRGKHIAEVIEILSNRIREIMNSSTGSVLASKKGEGNLSLSQMASALKALPEYQEVLSKLSQHMHLSHQCMDNFSSNGLMDLAEVEQTFATGKDEDGRSPKIGDLMDRVESLLLKMKTLEDKLRIILVCSIACNGLRDIDRRRLTNAAELTGRELRVLEALEVFGLSVSNSDGKNRPVSGLPGRQAEVDDESEYASSRYAPALKGILDAWAHDELSIEDFPSVTPMPLPTPSQSSRSSGGRSSRKSSSAVSSVRKQGGASSKWAASSRNDRKASSGPINFSGGRCITFVVGGVCYTELRAAQKVMETASREVIIGSTAFLTPNEFLEDLTKLAEKR